MADAQQVQVWIDRDYEGGVQSLRRLLQTVAPHIEPFDTLQGLVSQIDNYIAGLRHDFDAAGGMQRLCAANGERSHYERTHWVHCAESNEDVRSVIYDPNGNAMTYGELCAVINELRDENAELHVYKRAMDSMASQMIHPKMTGLEMAMQQLR